MRMRYVFVPFLLFLTVSGLANLAQGQQASSDSVRRIVRQMPPAYPELAKKMNLGGTVKVVAVVMANGDVKSVEPVGGSPVLIKAAQDAVAKWKFAPGAESKEIVELHFTPN
jgi:TonB family protein